MQQIPDGWVQLEQNDNIRPLDAGWEAQMGQWPELPFERLLLQNTAADDFLVGLADGRVSELHVSYHGDAGITFSSVVTYKSYGDWLANREIF